MVGKAGIWTSMNSRSWAQTGLSLEWFRANQIRKAWQKHRIFGVAANLEFKEKIFDQKRNKMTDRMMKNILTHANPEWRDLCQNSGP